MRVLLKHGGQRRIFFWLNLTLLLAWLLRSTRHAKKRRTVTRLTLELAVWNSLSFLMFDSLLHKELFYRYNGRKLYQHTEKEKINVRSWDIGTGVFLLRSRRRDAFAGRTARQLGHLLVVSEGFNAWLNC